MLPRPNDKLTDLHGLNLLDRKTQDCILSRQLSKSELEGVLHRIKSLLKKQLDPQSLSMLTELKRELRSKYSIDISKSIISSFIQTSEKVHSPCQQLDFQHINSQIKQSLGEINKRKYYLSAQNKEMTLTKKILSADKRRRRQAPGHNQNTTMPHIHSMRNFDEIFIKDKLTILQEYLDQQEIARINQDLLQKVEAIDQLNYGKYAERIKHYTIFDMILQKVFALVQEDTRNIQIRTRFQNIYRKMKEEMVAIVTNEEGVAAALKRLKKRSQENLIKIPAKNHPKKNYQPVDRDKLDLTSQIQETLEGANRHIRDAFIKRGRPDYAYEMELMLENRKVPMGLKRIRF